MYDLPDSAMLYADSARGVYIPQYFAESINRACVSGVTPEQWELMAMDPNDPETPEWFWDEWCTVEQNAIVTDSGTGIAYRLYQDGDLWLVPVDWTPSDD